MKWEERTSLSNIYIWTANAQNVFIFCFRDVLIDTSIVQQLQALTFRGQVRSIINNSFFVTPKITFTEVSIDFSCFGILCLKLFQWTDFSWFWLVHIDSLLLCHREGLLYGFKLAEWWFFNNSITWQCFQDNPIRTCSFNQCPICSVFDICQPQFLHVIGKSKKMRWSLNICRMTKLACTVIAGGSAALGDLFPHGWREETCVEMDFPIVHLCLSYCASIHSQVPQPTCSWISKWGGEPD